MINQSSFAQNILQKRISVSANQASIKEALSLVEATGGFYFSYNSDLIQEQKKVSFNIKDQTVETILNEILGDGFRYHISGKHIIIKLASGQGIVFSGRLLEAETGMPIEYASVYEKTLMTGTTTDANGNFKLYIRQALPQYELVIAKVSYFDTTLRLEKNFQPSEPLTLKRSYDELQAISVYSVEQHWLAKRLINPKIKFNTINLKGYFSRQPYQFSILPGLGSKNRLKSQSINKFSFNIIGGYSAGVKGFELGSGFNIVQQNMEYVQIAGLFNAVGGKAKGIQIAGAYNYVNKNVEGVQFSGIYNSSDSLKGVQAAGALNLVKKDVNGVQFSGIVNKALRLYGAQAAGFMNWNVGIAKGFQAAGVININDQFDGVQCAGFLNYTHQNTDGVQIGGVGNMSKKTLNGTQISALFNYAKKVNGTQIGLINIADSSSGLSLGLINIIKKGKHSIDFNTMEWQTYGLSYKSGNNRLYNIFQVGGNLHKNKKVLSFGYGIGNTINLSKKSSISHETIAFTLHAGNWNDQNILGRYQIMYQYNFSPNLRLYAGPAFNLLYFESKRTYEGFAVPYETQYPSFNPSNNIKAWLGWTVGISVF